MTQKANLFKGQQKKKSVPSRHGKAPQIRKGKRVVKPSKNTKQMDVDRDGVEQRKNQNGREPQYAFILDLYLLSLLHWCWAYPGMCCLDTQVKVFTLQLLFLKTTDFQLCSVKLSA
ncbi:hypothetical protein HAX54_042793 [Datura stramonium]|uniref:Uncharacterized protein n=1 Tax=Datura stramonium TaxID=4076 RepID=A0ABS8W1X6_DATST|nr:hypothetical protein [Datura stramonium]